MQPRIYPAADPQLKKNLQSVLWKRMTERQIARYRDPLDEQQWITLYGKAFEEFYTGNPTFFGEWLRHPCHETCLTKLAILECLLYKR